MEFGQPEKNEAPTGWIVGSAFLVGLLWGCWQGWSHNPDLSNIHVAIGVSSEAFFGGLFLAIPARIFCYFHNRNV